MKSDYKMDFDKLKDLPGFELIQKGLQKIENGNYDSIDAQLLLMARTRLNQEGFNISEHKQEVPPHLYFYRLLAKEHSDAHNMYNAFSQRLDKFCRALEQLQS